MCRRESIDSESSVREGDLFHLPPDLSRHDGQASPPVFSLSQSYLGPAPNKHHALHVASACR